MILWNHHCSWGTNVRGFRGSLLPTNLRPNEHALLYPTQRVAEGYNVFVPSVSPSVCQSVSPVFFCQRNSSETAQQNFVKLCSYEEHTMQMCIYTGNSDSIFFRGIMPLLNLEIWPHLNTLLKQFVSATPLKPLNRLS